MLLRTVIKICYFNVCEDFSLWKIESCKNIHFGKKSFSDVHIIHRLIKKFTEIHLHCILQQPCRATSIKIIFKDTK